MTSDISLLNDPDEKYIEIVKDFASDPSAFDDAFAHAWCKLTSRDMGPITRCMGDNVPPPQDWQYPLPSPPDNLADFDDVAAQLKKVLGESSERLPEFVRLAWQCASTFRQTDYQGGCNGARLRLQPQSDWPVNTGLDALLSVLEPIKFQYGEGLSWADLIVLAGNVGLEVAGGDKMSFCGGRVDALDGDLGSQYLAPKNISDVNFLREGMGVMGLTPRQLVALMGGVHSVGNQSKPLTLIGPDSTGYEGSWTTSSAELTNEYFVSLATEKWEPYTTASGKEQYKAAGKELYAQSQDLMLRYDNEYLAIVQEYAQDSKLFLSEFSDAWTSLMNADRFDGPTGNKCDKA